MSSTSQALGPNEPPEPPNWVMGQPYRRRSGFVGGPGSVCPAHDLSGRPPRHGAAGPGRRGGHRRVRPRIARPGRQLPAGDAPAARADDAGLRPAGLPGVAGRRGRRSGRPHRRPAGHRRRRLGRSARRGRRARWWPSGTASGATSWSARRWPSPGPSTPSGPSSRRCRGWGSAAQRVRSGAPCRGLAGDGRRPGRGGRALLLPHGGRGGVGPPDRRGPGATRRADGPALVADLRSLRSEGPPFDVTALDVPAVFGMGGPTSAAAPPPHACEWLGANVPGAVVYEIEGAQHGAHLSHPDHFAAMTRLVVERAGRPGGADQSRMRTAAGRPG